MVALRYICIKAKDGKTGACIIRELFSDKEAIERFLARLPCQVPWCGEGVPGLMQKALIVLLHADKQPPHASIQAQILEEKKHTCNMCRATFQGDLEWDHVAPLHSTCQKNEQIFQTLCTSCHADRTAIQGKQARTRVSRTSHKVWQLSVASKRPPPLVWSPQTHSGKQNRCKLDVCRCGKNALLHCPYDLPALCPFDNIKPADPCHIANFNFVELPTRGRYSIISSLPYVRPMFYDRVAIEQMLHYGLAVCDDIKMPTGRIRAAHTQHT